MFELVNVQVGREGMWGCSVGGEACGSVVWEGKDVGV